MARPRGAKARADEVRRAPRGRSIPTPSARSCTTNAFQLLVGDDPLGADHRRERQQGHARAVREVPDAARPRARRSRTTSRRIVHSTGFFRSKTKNISAWRARSTSEFDGEVPTELDDLVKLPGRRAQDRQRRALGGVRPARPARRHPRRAAVAPAEAHERDRPGEGGARPQRARPARGARAVLPAAHPARPSGVLRAQPRTAAAACSSTSARRPIPWRRPRSPSRCRRGTARRASSAATSRDQQDRSARSSSFVIAESVMSRYRRRPRRLASPGRRAARRGRQLGDVGLRHRDSLATRNGTGKSGPDISGGRRNCHGYHDPTVLTRLDLRGVHRSRVGAPRRPDADEDAARGGPRHHRRRPGRRRRGAPGAHAAVRRVPSRRPAGRRRRFSSRRSRDAEPAFCAALDARGRARSGHTTRRSCTIPARLQRRRHRARRGGAARSTGPGSTSRAGAPTYPSTVLMTAIPAQVAGVRRARAVRPARPRRRDRRSRRWRPRRSSGSTRCTASAAPRRSPPSPTAPRSIRPVDVIVGPGNAYVAAAKREVVGIGRHRCARGAVGGGGRRRRRPRLPSSRPPTCWRRPSTGPGGTAIARHLGSRRRRRRRRRGRAHSSRDAPRAAEIEATLLAPAAARSSSTTRSRR